MVGGFGNLRGRIEMWNVATNALISTFDAPDSTDVKWSPDGQHILTTTCAPRLRSDNIVCTVPGRLCIRIYYIAYTHKVHGIL